MKLYNTLTKQIDELKPIDASKITVYTCGPTVYDYAHIGHWFNYIRMDMLIRALKASGYTPQWVMNITDVGHLVSDADDGEDKLEKGARRENKTAWEVAEFYTQDFLECMRLLNITQPNNIVKATDHIDEQIALIQRLEAKGFTYVIDDGVYYDTSKFEGYAAFARLDLSEQQEGARVAVNTQKRNASDFALWKFSPEDSQRDMEWDSPWQPGANPRKGFPGWHIECSAMSMTYLGDTLDIHTGGIDHIPVHHTNEIAQSEAATGKRFANHWLHSNHVMVDGEKISKSLGNGIRLQAIIKQGISPEAVRLHVLESHYRSQSKFSIDSLQAAASRLKELQAMAVLRYQTANISDDHYGDISRVKQLLIDQLTDDLATPAVMASLSEVASKLNSRLINDAELTAFTVMLADIDELLGLKLSDLPDITSKQKTLIKDRELARKSQDWAKSDELRNELTRQNIGVRDTPAGAIWYWLQP